MKEKDINGKLLYPNHYQLKQNRLIKLQQCKARCEICGKNAHTIHHKDLSINNHALKNLIVLCRRCHVLIHLPHSDRDKMNFKILHTSKFIRKYGMTLKGIASKLNSGQTTIWLWHKKRILQDKLNSIME